MKSYLIPFVVTLAGLTSVGVNAGVSMPVIPSAPTVTAPADQAVNISLTPELTSSEYDDQTVQSTLDGSNWLVFKNVEGVELLSAGRNQDNPPIEVIDYEPAFPISISGSAVSNIQIDPLSYAVRLINAQDVTLAQIEFGNYDDWSFQENSEFIVVKNHPDFQTIQWHLKDAAEKELILEAVILKSGTVGWRTSPNDYSDDLFLSSSINASCSMSIDPANSTSDSISKSLAGWKSSLSGSYDHFFLACATDLEDGAYVRKLKVFNPSDVTSYLPEVKSFSSTTGDFTLASSDTLDPSTTYTVQVQQFATDTVNPSMGVVDLTTAWSAPVTFTTRAPNSNYQVTAPTDLAFTSGQAKTLEFTVANSGSEAGSPQVIVSLPYSALSGLNGTLTDFFEATLDGQECAFQVVNSKTNFTCGLTSLAAGADVKLAAKVTAYDVSVKNIEYKVCEPTECAATDFTSLAVTVTEAAGSSSGGSSTSSSSSSGGGSAFWMLLFAPLLLVRRRQ